MGQLLSLREAYKSNLSLLQILEPFEKFVVGGWWLVSKTILVISLKHEPRLINSDCMVVKFKENVLGNPAIIKGKRMIAGNGSFF